MPKIVLNTSIDAPREIVFNLARSIDFHKQSSRHTSEDVIAGKTGGLIELGESVTWRAKHFGFWRILESEITEFDSPNYFVDEMVSGDFKSFKHTHSFIENDNKVIMKDVFDYSSPFGFVGRFVDWLFLKRYMRQFLIKRNNEIKEYAEKSIHNSIFLKRDNN